MVPIPEALHAFTAGQAATSAWQRRANDALGHRMRMARTPCLGLPIVAA
jgi:hypothetical protein